MKHRILPVVLILSALDQAVKQLIRVCFSAVSVPILPGLLSFAPVLNTKMSWYGSLGVELFAIPIVAIAFNLAIFVAALVLYRYLGDRGRFQRITFSFLFAGLLCSTIDRVSWGGSLDYIRLEGFFTFDLKDLYITAFQVLFVLGYILYMEAFRDFKLRDFFIGSRE